MNNQEFEKKIQDFWKEVQAVYEPFVCKGGILDNKLYYVFQTPYYYAPNLLFVGINPGGDYLGEGTLQQKNNGYVNGGLWFSRLHKIFDYPKNEYLKTALDTCVATNCCFINSKTAEILPPEVMNASYPLITELVGIVSPKHIIALGKVPFEKLVAVKNRQYKQFGSIKFKYGYTDNGLPVAWVYNPSGRNQRFYTDKLCPDWQAAIEWFMTL